jgi:hypothetical protein
VPKVDLPRKVAIIPIPKSEYITSPHSPDEYITSPHSPKACLESASKHIMKSASQYIMKFASQYIMNSASQYIEASEWDIRHPPTHTITEKFQSLKKFSFAFV